MACHINVVSQNVLYKSMMAVHVNVVPILSDRVLSKGEIV